MAIKTASVTLEGGELRFMGRTGSGHAAVLDSGAGDTGMRPAELIPLALAGCTAMDVISILRKKRQAVRSYSVEVAGTQADDHPNAFTRLDVTHVVEGSGVEVEAVRRAIELSATLYCSVGATLGSGDVEIHHAVQPARASGISSAGRLPTGQPHVRLHGRAAARAEQLGMGRIAVSITHESEYAVAIAFGVRTAGGRFLFPPDIEARLDDRERRILARMERMRALAEAIPEAGDG